jgi:hypothetical protein
MPRADIKPTDLAPIIIAMLTTTPNETVSPYHGRMGMVMVPRLMAQHYDNRGFKEVNPNTTNQKPRRPVPSKSPGSPILSCAPEAVQ